MTINELLAKASSRQSVQWAIECAEHVLPIFEGLCPGDMRPRAAIEAAKQFLAGTLTLKELNAAQAEAFCAHADVDSGMASHVAFAAYRAAYAAEEVSLDDEGSVEYANWAAWGAREATGGDKEAERRWQQDRLVEILGIA